MNDFSELARRCMIVKTMKAEVLRAELDDLQLIDGKGFSDGYNQFWQDENIGLTYRSQRKSLSRKKISYLPSERWILSLDLVTTGIVTGRGNVSGSLSFTLEYWQWHAQAIDDDNGALKGSLKQVIDGLRFSHDN